MAQSPQTKLKPSEWKKRRRVLYASLTILFGLLSYIIILGEDTSVNKEAVLPLVAGIIALAGTYVFGAAWDDKNYMNALSKQTDMFGGYEYEPKE